MSLVHEALKKAENAKAEVPAILQRPPRTHGGSGGWIAALIILATAFIVGMAWIYDLWQSEQSLRLKREQTLAEKAEELTGKEAQLSNVLKKRTELEEELGALSSSLEATVAEYEARIKDYDTRIANLEAETESLRSEYESIQGQRELLSKDLGILRIENASKDRKIAELSQRLQEAAGEELPAAEPAVSES